MPKDKRRSETIKLVGEHLSEIGVPESHRICDLVEEIYDKTDYSTRPEMFAAGLAYLVTQCDSDYEHVSQRQVSEITGVSERAIRTHYQEIARGIDFD